MFSEIGVEGVLLIIAVLAFGTALAWVVLRVVGPAPRPPVTPPPARPGPRDLADRLAQLTELHDAGSLTDEEFESAKNAALEGR